MTIDSVISDQPTFNVAVDYQPGRLHVVVSGDFDLAGKGPFLDAVSAQRPFALPVTVDLTDVGFIDSSGLRCLLYVDQWAAEDAVGRVRLAGVAANVRHLFEVSGIEERFDLE